MCTMYAYSREKKHLQKELLLASFSLYSYTLQKSHPIVFMGVFTRKRVEKKT